MSCDKCKNDPDVIMQEEIIGTFAWGWGTDDYKINQKQAEKHMIKLGVFIDRGYLRMVNIDDCNCMDNGEKVKIEFCPFCGSRLRYDENNIRIED